MLFFTFDGTYSVLFAQSKEEENKIRIVTMQRRKATAAIAAVQRNSSRLRQSVTVRFKFAKATNQYLKR